MRTIFPDIKIGLVHGQIKQNERVKIMQAFAVFLAKFHLLWALPIFAGLIVFGSLGKLISSIIGPSKGLFGAAVGGEIPPLLSRVNRYGMPVNMFILQGVVVTFIALLF